MLATKNRAAAMLVSLLAAAVFLAACAPPGPRALLAGKDLLDAGNDAAAIQELQTATTLMPTNAAAWNYLGVAYHRAGQWTNAVTAYSQALRFNRELLEARFNLGCLLLEQGNLDAAKAEFTAYTLRRSNVAEGWVKLATVQLQMRELVAAEKNFQEALRLDGGDVAAWNGLGLVLAQRNRPREAAESFAAALQQQGDFRPALLNLATVLHQQLNDRAGALKHYRAYLALQPREANWDAVEALVRSLAPPATPVRLPAANQLGSAPSPTNGVRALAAPSVRPAPPTNQAKPTVPPVVIPVVKSVAVSRPASNPPPPAPEIVKLTPEPVIKTTPVDLQAPGRAVGPAPTVEVSPVVRNSTAAPAKEPKAERQGMLSKLNPFKRPAAPAAPKSEAKAPNPQPVIAAERAVASGRYAYLKPGVPPSGDRRAAEQVLVQGQEAQRARRLAEAMQYYLRATQLDGSYFEAHYLMGLAAYELRSFQSAATAWETALAIRPDSSDARYNFALTLHAAGYLPEAVAELEKFLTLHPDEARGHLTLGNLCAEQLRDKTRARQHYQRVLQLDPQNPEAPAIRYWLVANPS